MAQIEMTCPWCLREVNIEEQELRGKEFRCPACGATAPWAPDPAQPGKTRAAVKRRPTTRR